MITKLTKEQEDKMKDYVEKYTNVGLDTTPISLEASIEAIKKVYKCGGIKPPKEFIYCASPLEAQKKIKEYAASKGIELRGYISSTLEGQHNASLVATYMYYKEVLGLEKEVAPLEGIVQLTMTTGWLYAYDDVAFYTDRPRKLYRNSRNQLHSDDCAAIEYADGLKLFFWNGTKVPEYVIMNPEKITMEDILKERNQEVRRVKIIKYGIERFIEDGEVEEIDSHIEFGTLYKTKTLKDFNGKPFAFLKVLNHTQEPDGTYKPYMLRVDPAHTKVIPAWQSTFRKVKNFLPSVET